MSKKRRAANPECQTIADWLTLVDYGPQHRDIFDRCEEGTGKWLLDSTEFHNWLIGNNLTLFCSGMPGAGKTIIISTVIEHLWTKFQHDPRISIAFLYCNYKSQQNQKPTDLLAALLKQLVQEQSSPPQEVHSLYKRCVDKRIPPSFQEISEAFRAVVASYSRTFILIDALDECQLPDGGRDKFLSAVFEVQAKTGANLFATSRFIPEITEKFNKGMRLEIRASNQDVQRYLDSHMSQLPGCVLRSSDLQDEIKTDIIKAVDGMYVVLKILVNNAYST